MATGEGELRRPGGGRQPRGGTDPNPSFGQGGDDSSREEQLRGLVTEEEGDDGPPTLEDEFGEQFFWQDAVVDQIMQDIEDVAEAYDIDEAPLLGWFAGQQVNLLNYLTSYIRGTSGPGAVSDRTGFYTGTPEGINSLFTIARAWVGTQVPGFGEAILGLGRGSGRRQGRRGSGRRGPTAAEIRAQFDVEELTGAVTAISRGLLVTEIPSAGAIAKGFIDAVVASGGEQNIDFETFARQRILDTPRAKTIYANKPDSISHEQFLQPYVQAFLQRVGPGFDNQLAELAIGGARLRSSPQAFQARLEKTAQVQRTSPFLSKLGQRIAGISEVLR